MKIVFFIILLSLLCNPSLKSHDMNIDYLSNKEIGKVGVKLYKNKDISAIDYLKAAYEKKQFWVGYYLSKIYTTDIYAPFVEKDYAKAADYLLTAAKSNCPKSQFKLAQWLFKGNIVQKNITEGLNWLTKSANSGYYLAQIQLGAYYYNGGDLVKAEFWLVKSIESNLFNPKYLLAKIYINQKKYIKSIKLIINILKETNDEKVINKIAAELNKLSKVEDIKFNKKLCFALGLLHTKKFVYKKACYWLEKAAEQEYNKATNQLKNLSKKNIAEAQFVLGKIYKDKDTKKALKYFKKAQKNGCILAKFDIAKLSINK